MQLSDHGHRNGYPHDGAQRLGGLPCQRADGSKPGVPGVRASCVRPVQFSVHPGILQNGVLYREAVRPILRRRHGRGRNSGDAPSCSRTRGAERIRVGSSGCTVCCPVHRDLLVCPAYRRRAETVRPIVCEDRSVRKVSCGRE